MKNVYVLTATQNQQLGYALDSKWYGIPEYTEYMRKGLSGLTVEKVNAAVKKHLQWKDAFVVMIADDAEGLKKALVSDAFSPISSRASATSSARCTNDKAIQSAFCSRAN